LALAAPCYSSKASDVYHRAQKLEKAGNIVQAYLLYAEASALEPANAAYRSKAASLRGKADGLQKLLAAAKPAEPEPEPEPDGEEDDAEPAFTTITTPELQKARAAQPPAELKLPTGHFDFHFNGFSNDLFNLVALRCGLQTAFDGEYAQGPKVRFDIEDVDCRDALHAAESATSSFVAPLSSKLILVSKDTPLKRAANEQTMSIVVPVPTAMSTQDITEIAQAVKQVAGVDKLAWNSTTGEIVIRDRVSRARIAQAVAEQLISYRGGVMIDLRFLQLSDTEMLTFGGNVTNTFSIIWGGSQSVASAGTTLANLLRAFSIHQFWITGLNATVVAQLTQSRARTIFQTEVRSINNLPATLHVGEKYPVLSSGYFGGTPNSPTAGSAGVYTPPASFTYYDLGISLKVLPVIGNDDLITMDIDSDYALLAGQAINGIPILANRKMTTRIAIHNDEWALIGGLMDDTDSKSISGIAGLARFPLVGWLFKTQNHEKDRDHIVILMKPHILGEAPSSHETSPLWVGTETRPLSPL
jgi:general secretion pathway protein D